MRRKKERGVVLFRSHVFAALFFHYKQQGSFLRRNSGTPTAPGKGGRRDKEEISRCAGGREELRCSRFSTPV